ncbi:MAG: dihydrokaempferol 4-reductase [Myxococcales bacterium 68-20]|nr:NAD-dependent epimerase/dehydratase family protein [Myxococcales bacterium]OJY22943.1 MAG: dihydrokaempferol 4-reductase [Myxococcales bacterium 68-20]
MSSKYLVTGATGFLGRHLVHTLLDKGHAVVALVRRKGADLPESVTQVEGDILDQASIEAALAGCAGVFHCAGKVSRKPDDAETLYKLHVEGTKNVTAACIAQGVRRVVVASTSGTIAVSDDPDRVATEDDDTPIGLLNRWPYYRSKLFAEKAALERHGAPLAGGSGETLEVVCVNPTLLLGPGDVNGSSTEDVRLFLERKIPAIPPGGLSYVDARDAASAMLLAMDRGVGGRRYLVGACNLTLKEFFARLERVSGVRGPVLPMPRQAREIARTGAEMLERFSSRLGIPVAVDPISLDMAHFYWYLDASLAENELGWAPRDPVQTLVDTVRDLEERGVVWPDVGGSLLSTIRRRVTNIQDHT